MDIDVFEKRLVELESRHMHQEHLVDELNQVVIEQRERLERLERELNRLRAEMTSGQAAEDAGDVPPPHY